MGICLPDEVNFLKQGGVNPRPLAVPRDETLPLYVQAYKARIAKSGEALEISLEKISRRRRRALSASHSSC